MRKEYRSESDISLSVVCQGGNKRIRFDTLTNGGSVFATADKLVQSALEKHPRFGELFVLAGSLQDSVEKSEINPLIIVELEKVEVSSLQQAKDILCEQKGIPLSNLKTKAAILKAAKANGMELVGLPE